jgi:(2Fe-2S) ferredoxin
MEKPDHHVLVCSSFRLNGDAKGVCHKKGAADLLQYLQGEINDRGLAVAVSCTGCLSICEKGPVMVVYPEGAWYGQMDTDRIDKVLDAMEEGKIVEEYLLT